MPPWPQQWFRPAEWPVVHYVPDGNRVNLWAFPDPNHRVRSWHGTDNDASVSTLNTVTVTGPTVVTLTLEHIWTRTLHVAADYSYQYTDIQDAIDDARSGDTVVVHTGTYPGGQFHQAIGRGPGYYVAGKDITITSTAPDDPCIVAATVIDCTGQNGGGFQLAGTGTSVLNGFTIRGLTWGGGSAPSPIGEGARGLNGGSNIVVFPGFWSNAGISVFGNHIIANCVVEDFWVRGDHASGGNDGGDTIPVPRGGDGGTGGSAAGAGIWVGWGSPVIRNCTIRRCRVTPGNAGDGGAGLDGGLGPPFVPGGGGGDGGVPGQAYGAGIYCAPFSNPTFEKCMITDNLAEGGNGGDGGYSGDWGGYYGGYGGLTDYDPNQRDPAMFTAKGAGAYCDQWSTVTFKDCTFGNNRCIGSVSGLGGIGHPSGVQQWPRVNYNVPSFGGGVHCAEGSAVAFVDCTVENNRATHDLNGLAAGVDYTGYGGGICVDGNDYPTFHTNVGLSDCNVIGNFAPIVLLIYAVDTEDLHLDDCALVNNSSYVGGGLLSIESSTTISGCTIRENIASQIAAPNLVDPNVDPNMLPPGIIYGAGGGLYIFTSDANVVDCIITENTSSGSGGGVYLGGHRESLDWPATGVYAIPELKNCLITNNTADRDGAGISCNWYVEPVISNCTIVDNTVTGVPFTNNYGGGLYCSYDSHSQIKDSILWGNLATYGPEIAIGGGDWAFEQESTLEVTYCDVSGGADGAFVDTNCVLIWGDPGDPCSVPFDADPLFVSGSLVIIRPVRGYYLSHIATGQEANSPCVDSGSDLASSLGMGQSSTRVDGAYDVCDVDLGYHYGRGLNVYQLTVSVVQDPFDPGIHGTVTPTSGTFYEGDIVKLVATPYEGYGLKAWTGTTNPNSVSFTNYVMMSSDMNVTVEFKKADSFHVPGLYNTIVDALTAIDPIDGRRKVRSGDTVIVSEGSYGGGIDFEGRSITIVSEHYDDPDAVANTIVDCGGAGPAFIFQGGEGADAIIDGFTIVGGDAVGNSSSPNAPGSIGEDAFGGAITSVGASSPTIINCIIRDCMARGRFGGDGVNQEPNEAGPGLRGGD
ncbi:MAG: InlB B-repeat-containing protein, partial [Planctomycetota bacterium]